MSSKRVYECKLCGWRSRSFGTINRIDEEKAREAYSELLMHLREKHDIEAFPFPDYAVVRILRPWLEER